MKEIVYSFILIVCTFISVTTMIYFNNYQDIKVNEFHNENIVDVKDEKYISDNIEQKGVDLGYYEESHDKKIDEYKSYDEKINSDSIENDEYGNDLNNNVNTYRYTQPNNYKSNNNSYNDSYNSNKNISNKYSSKINIDELLDEETATVFKVNKNTIPSKISNKDKLKMLKMANSLSINDYKSVAENIKRSDELAAATDIFSVLKDKLSSENYKELKKILTPYIDIDLIEKNIDKK